MSDRVGKIDADILTPNEELGEFAVDQNIFASKADYHRWMAIIHLSGFSEQVTKIEADEVSKDNCARLLKLCKLFINTQFGNLLPENVHTSSDMDGD